jgi:hypothetical protein
MPVTVRAVPVTLRRTDQSIARWRAVTFWRTFCSAAASWALVVFRAAPCLAGEVELKLLALGVDPGSPHGDPGHLGGIEDLALLGDHDALGSLGAPGEASWNS